MAKNHFSVREQLRRNAVALISLVVAISSLGYNTWRNERSEANRTVRAAGFQLMSNIAELQKVVMLSHYDMDSVRGNPRIGWTHVIAVRDLSYSMPAEVRAASQNLFSVWQDNWAGVADSNESLQRVEAAIDQAKSEILGSIRALD